ncbi:MAG: hypothetical protein DMF56_10350 [Acidobacteria bacterium]|nr:MAG: hypothetical protein DMF56_10350 [Acidobacteriota bacterium]
MNADIATKKVGSKWHGSINGRPDLEETALSEKAVRQKMEQLLDQIGTCGSMTRLFGGRTCDLIAGHHVPGEKRTQHRSGSVTWIEVSPADGAVPGVARSRGRNGRSA